MIVPSVCNIRGGTEGFEPHLYCRYKGTYIYTYVGVRRKGKDLWGSEHSTLVVEEGNADLIRALYLNTTNT